jgi:neutral ceramidase
MNNIQAGFGLIEITPLVGTPLVGQFRVRYATGVNDPLYARVLALRQGENDSESVIIIVLDVCKVGGEDIERIRDEIITTLPVPRERVWFYGTHTHTGPALTSSFETPRAEEYAEWLAPQVRYAAETAWYDLAPAAVKSVQTKVDEVAFIRRFVMKDGSVQTNPRIGNPDIDHPAREARTVLSLVEFERDPTRLPIVFASFPCHADVTGGTEVSADYPGRVCNDLTHRVASHPETLFALGPCGDLNHIDVAGEPRSKGFDHACAMAQRLGDAALGAWESRTSTEGGLDVRNTTITVKRREIPDTELSEARDILTRESGGGKELSNDGLFARELTLLSELPTEIELEIGAIIIGDVAIVGLPGEPFSELSERIGDAAPQSCVVCTELFNNGSAGYLPTEGAYSQSGYEQRAARSSPFAPGTGEQVVEAAIALLQG